MTKERIKFALVLCDFERQDEVEKSEEIKRKLGDLGIQSYTSDIENDGFTPSTPWLEYEGVIYYTHEIDRIMDVLQTEHVATITGE